MAPVLLLFRYHFLAYIIDTYICPVSLIRLKLSKARICHQFIFVFLTLPSHYQELILLTAPTMGLRTQPFCVFEEGSLFRGILQMSLPEHFLIHVRPSKIPCLCMDLCSSKQEQK